MPPSLDVIVAPSLDRWDLLGLELHWLEAIAARQCAPVLLIYTMPGQLVSIGRYHPYRGPAERAGVGASRRLTGGRVTGAGEGWLGVALISPHRTALLPKRDAQLKPDQVMNRYARGILGSLRAIGLEGFYPGRDAITFQGREVAMCSFETDASGAMLFEALLAVNRGMEEVAHDLDALDPEGSLTCPMYGRDEATTVARALNRDAAIHELAMPIARGYEGLLGAIRMREMTQSELAQGEQRGRALAAAGWLNRLGRERATDRFSRATSQLGAVEARVSLTAGATIERIAITGDLIANSPGLTEFENEVIGKPLDLASVSTAVMRVYGDGRNFILGIGELENLARLVAQAQ